MANDLPPGMFPPPIVLPPPLPGGGGTPPGGDYGPPPPTSNTAPSIATDTNAAANSVVEGAAVNTTVGVTAHSTDSAQSVTYSLASDNSGGGFKIDSVTGVVTVADPTRINFETAPGHAYTITVNSSDGITSSSQSFTIGVTDIAPSTPVDSNAGANTVAEGAAANTLVGVTASSTDINGPGVTWSLSDSANGAFKIDAATGVVSVADPSKIDFENTAPGHTLGLTAVASDGTLSSSQNFTINVSDISLTTPVDGNAAANTIAEGAANGSTVGITASAVDPNGPATTYSLIGDTSLGGFTINTATGVVTVADANKINFETAPGHAYSVTVQATSGAQTTSQAFSIGVTDVAPATPTDSNGAADTVLENAANGTAVGITASSSDPGGGPAPTYTLTDSASGRFAIDLNTGIVTVANGAAIDYETAPGHAYGITVQATAGALTSTQNFSIAVGNVNEAPVNAVPGAQTVLEDTNLVFSGAKAITISDVDGGSGDETVTLTVTSGTLALGSTLNLTAFTNNAASITLTGTIANINAALNGLTYKGNSNFNGADSLSIVTHDNGNTGGGDLTDTDSIAINVTAVNDTPSFTVGGTQTVLEDSGAHTVNGFITGISAGPADEAGQTVNFLTSNDNNALFSAGPTIDASGNLTYTLAANANGSATVTVQIHDDGGTANGGSDTSVAQTFTITAGSVNDAPAGTNNTFTLLEDGARSFTAADFGFTDPVDAANTSGANAFQAVIITTIPGAGTGTLTLDTGGGPVAVVAGQSIPVGQIGGLAFTPAANANGNGEASFTFQVQDTGGTANAGIDTDQSANTITFNVTAINDAPAGTDTTIASVGAHTFAASEFGFTDPVDAGSASGANAFQAVIITTVPGAGTGTLTLDTGGGPVAVIAGQSIPVGQIGGLVFTPVGNNTGTFTFQVQDNGGTANSGVDTDQSPNSFTISQNAAPIIDSDGGAATASASTAENSTAVTTVHATDSDAGPSPITYSIVPGDDGAKFSIVASGAGAGTLTFISAPDFENPTDVGATAGNNTYVVTVRAFDGASFDDQTITVTVTNVNDAPVIGSNGGGATASINVNENGTAITTVTSTDQDSPTQTLTYSLAGGLDQAKFSIDPGTGVLTFIAAPNFEVPTDNGGDNGYDVIVRVTDNGAPNLHDDQAITVHVQDVNEAPDTGATIATGNEDAASIAITVTGTDVDSGDAVATFHITNIPNTGTQGTLYSDIGLTTQVTEGADVAASGNAATLYFVPNANFNGSVAFNAAATDTHGLTDATPATETINVTAVNDGPLNSGAPASFTVGAGFSHTVTGLSISDVDAGAANDITTTFTAGTGLVSIGNGTSGGTAGIAGGATVSTNATGTVLLTGTIAEINTSLSGNNVVYTAGDSAANTATTLQIATNDQGHTGTPGAITDTDTINIGVIPQVWFINQDQSTLDSTAPRGSQTNPFATVDEFNASSGPGVNDYIYVKAGTYSGEGINLKAGQTLLGDDQALSFANPLGGPAIQIEDATGARPIISVNAANATDQGIALASGNTVAGINVVTNASGQVGVDDSGASVGTLNISAADVTGSGQAINITHGGTGGSMTFGTVSSSGGTVGIALGGALVTTFSATSGTLSGHSTSEVSINGGSGNVSYGGAIGDGTGLSASIVNHTGGTVTFSGNISDGADTDGGIGISGNANTTINFTGAAKTLNTGIGDGVSMTNNTGTSNVNFTNGGLDIDTTNGTGFQASVAGTYSVTGSGNSITVNGNGAALNLDTIVVGAGGLTFDSTSSTNSTGTAVAIDSVTGGAISLGTGSISGSDGDAFRVGDGAGTAGAGGTSAITYSGSISKTDGTGQAVDIQDRAAGAGNITLSGNITHNLAANTGILLDDNLAGTITFSGSSKAITSTTATAVNLTDNNGATIAFTNGGLVINTTAGNGFNATGPGAAATSGGTVTVEGSGNTVTSTTGIALNVINTTIGANDLTFQSVAANGGANGIVLNNTGSSGGLHITGTGTTDGSGGTIQNISGSGVQLINTADVSIKNLNLTSANTVDGTSLDLDISNARGAIYMSGVTTVVLDNININGTADNGITGLNVSNFTLANSTITQAGNAANESGIEFSNLSGTSAITNSDISFSETNSVDILNTDVNLNLTVTGSTFRDTQTVSSGGATNGNGEGGIQFRNFSSLGGSPTANIIIDNSQFLRLRTQGIQVIGEDDSTTNVDITDSTIDSGADIGAGIDINGNDLATVNFNIFRDIIHSRGGAAVNITSFLDANVQGRVQDNSDITANGTGAGGSGVRAVAQETSQLTILVKNNNITAAAGNNSTPIDMQARFQNARLDLTLDNNNITADPAALADINITSGSSTAGESNQVYANIINNDVLAGGPTNLLRLRVSDLSNTNRLFLTGFVEGGAGIEDDAVATWNANANTPSVTAATVTVSLTGSAVAPSAGIALTPTNPVPSTLRAAPGGVAGSSAGDNDLTQAELAPIVAAAIAQWKDAGASYAQLGALAAIKFTVADLGGNMIGDHTPGNIVIDTNAAGHGWFVDVTPGDNFEFAHAMNAAGTDLSADPSSAAAGHLDLLTAVMHEMGHELGLVDLAAAADANNLMYIHLVDGERRLPDAIDILLAPTSTQTPTISLGPVDPSATAGSATAGTPGNDIIDAGHGGGILFGGGGADNFVFAHVDIHGTPPAAITHVTDYHFAEGDTFDFSALTSQFHATGIADGMIVRAVEDSSGNFATLQVNTLDPNGPPAAANWVSVAQIDSAHSGDAVNVTIDSHSAVHLAQIHVGLLV